MIPPRPDRAPPPPPAPRVPRAPRRVRDERPSSRRWFAVAVGLAVLAGTGTVVGASWVTADMGRSFVSVRPFVGELTRCRTSDEVGGAIWHAEAQYGVTGATGGSSILLSTLWRWDPDPSRIDPDAALSVGFTDEIDSYVTWERTEAGHVWLQMPLDRAELLEPPGRTLRATLEISGQPIATCLIAAEELADP